MPGDGDGRRFRPCPLAGLRAGDLASGAVQRQIENLASLSKEDLLQQISGLSEEEMLNLLEVYEMGKNHVLATVANKLQNWQTMPWRLAALSVPDERQAREIARSILDDFACSQQDPNLHHRLTWFWLKTSGDFKSQLEAFAGGEPLNALPKLRRAVLEMAFIPVAGTLLVLEPLLVASAVRCDCSCNVAHLHTQPEPNPCLCLTFGWRQ